MDFTETQKGLLFSAWGLATHDRGMVLTDNAVPDADELVEHGWLDRRPLDDGDCAYFWSQAAALAVELGALTDVAQAPASQN